MILNTFEKVRESREDILEGVNLSDQYCGLFRCPLPEAFVLLPDLKHLFQDAFDMLKEQGHNPYHWEMDLKIHMLMKDQYCCIPNWHCDNVPRVEGKTDYSLIKEDTPPMYLWLSDSPTTEFLSDNISFINTPNSHGELSDMIKSLDDKLYSKAPSKTWIAMDQRTPHRGTVATKHGWRVFVRLTHNSITPVRPVNNYIRRHCQVYLDSANFSW